MDARAERAISESDAAARDEYELDAYSSTYLHVFQRALLPGPGGALMADQTFAPVHEYFSLRAREVDGPLHDDSVDLELSAWGSLWLPEAPNGQQAQWDVSLANVTQRIDRTALKMGRQVISGGAARYSRFDGARVDVNTPAGVVLTAYVGLTALPRWDGRPGYYQLGSAADTLLTNPEIAAEPARSGYWLAGARADYHAKSDFACGLSYHEQRAAAELDRRQVGLDVSTRWSEKVDLTAASVLDADSARLVDARVFVDYRHSLEWLFSVSYYHAEPALFLSRQSLLSVFATDNYDEFGAELELRPLQELHISTHGYAQVQTGAEIGARSGVNFRFMPAKDWLWSGGYRRVLLSDAGYHSLRGSLRLAFAPEVAVVADVHGYFYDRPIQGYLSSSVYALSGDWALSEEASLLGGVSALRSPYASLDLQALVRFNYAFHLSSRELD